MLRKIATLFDLQRMGNNSEVTRKQTQERLCHAQHNLEGCLPRPIPVWYESRQRLEKARDEVAELRGGQQNREGGGAKIPSHNFHR